MMRFMFDLHGVLNKNPKVYIPFLRSLVDNGHFVLVCSGSKMNKLQVELSELGYERGVHYHKMESIHRFLEEEKGVIFTYDERGHHWCDDGTWWGSKALIATENNIDIMVDDTPMYYEYVCGSRPIFLQMK